MGSNKAAIDRPVVIVGDVQGDVERLMQALEEFDPDEVNTVFLGDFFQGGKPGTGGGIAAARYARQRQNSSVILGNHDLLILAVLEEVRWGITPNIVKESGLPSLATVWLSRRGDWADLAALDADPELEEWMRSLPFMVRLSDGTLVQHCDHDAYAGLGDTVDEVNNAARDALAKPGNAWKMLHYTVGRRAFSDPHRLELYLRHFNVVRVVHGHTPHHGNQPLVENGGRTLNFDGCFSRYWEKDSEGVGPISATIDLLPAYCGM